LSAGAKRLGDRRQLDEMPLGILKHWIVPVGAVDCRQGIQQYGLYVFLSKGGQ
jgi:hypothetical protein